MSADLTTAPTRGQGGGGRRSLSAFFLAWGQSPAWRWQRFPVALALVVAAAALRVWPLYMLGTTLAWLTFYPAVMLAAVCGGFSAGLLGTGLACCLVTFGWPLLGGAPFIDHPSDWLGLAVFVLTGTMISTVAEAMLRANERARNAQIAAETANRAKSVFLANMSHELRTPLNAILGFSSLLRNRPNVPEEECKTLEIINRSGEHLLTLINDVLDMAKVESGRASVQAAPFDLGEMALDVTDLMRLRAAEKGLRLLLEQASECPRFVRADGPKLRQILINLTGNAVKFTARGTVTLRLGGRVADGAKAFLLVVEVEDTGVGIAEENRERIFDPFVQVGDPNGQKGTGLGLAITRKYVELMGGTLSVKSEPGCGSRFRVELPVERAAEAELARLEISSGRVVGLAQGQPDYRLLIVEDREENWLLLRRLLEEVGFRVRVATSGEEGVELFATWRPHLIWMDIRMAGMDGLEATRRIREREGGRDVKIVAVSASVFREERDNVMRCGLDDFIRKPYRANEIYDCLVRNVGVRFTYERARETQIISPAAAVRSGALAAQPQAWRDAFAQALTRLDVEKIASLVAHAAERDPELGKALSRHAEQFAYTALLRELRSACPAEKEVP